MINNIINNGDQYSKIKNVINNCDHEYNQEYIMIAISMIIISPCMTWGEPDICLSTPGQHGEPGDGLYCLPRKG